METIEPGPIKNDAPVETLDVASYVDVPDDNTPQTDQPIQAEAVPEVVPNDVVAQAVSSQPVSAPAPQSQAVTTPFVVFDYIRVLPYAWLLGAALSMLMPLIGLLGITHLNWTSRPIADKSWLELLHKLQSELGVNRRVTLLRADNINTAITWSVLRPKLLLPASADSWSESKRRAVLLHELAHIQRCDWAIQMLTHLACALHWFNPLVWWMSRRMYLDREQASDDVVLSVGISPVDYASQLVEIASRIRLHHSLAAIPAAQQAALRQRVCAVLDPKCPRDAVGRMALIGAFIGCCCIAVPVSMLEANATGSEEQVPIETAHSTPAESESVSPSPAINNSSEAAADADPQDPPLTPNARQVALPAEIVQAWKEARAEVWWRQLPGDDIYEYKADGSRGISAYAYTGVQPRQPNGYHPSFILPGWRAGVVSQLPVPQMPFELRLNGTNVTDEGLKELSQMTNLHLLNLENTELTDAGLKERLFRRICG